MVVKGCKRTNVLIELHDDLLQGRRNRKISSYQIQMRVRETRVEGCDSQRLNYTTTCLPVDEETGVSNKMRVREMVYSE